MTTRPRPRTLAAVAIGLALLAVGAALILRHAPSPSAPPKVAADNLSVKATACLAADSATATKGDLVAKIWSAMQEAAGSNVNVEQVITPAADATQAQPHLAGLVSQRCDLIITVGPAFGLAVPDLAKAVPGAKFTVVDAGLTAALPDVTPLGATGAEAKVGSQVRGLVRAGG